MIAVYILLGLFVLIGLLLLAPVHAQIGYRETLEVQVQWLFLRRKLLPEPEEPAEKPKQETSKSDGAPSKRNKSNALLEKFRRFRAVEGFSGFLRLVQAFVRLTGTSAAALIRRLRIRDFDLYVLTGGEDAAAAAILYGKTCAVVYPAAEALFALAPCKRRRVSVDLDYGVKTPRAQLSADVSIRLIFLVYYGLRYLIGLYPIYQRFNAPHSGAKRKG